MRREGSAKGADRRPSAQAAAAIVAEARGEEPRQLRFGYLVQCVSLGRRDSLIQSVRHDDSPRERSLTGRPAARAKEEAARSTIRLLHLARRHPGALRLAPGIV
ncbi:hypothetical protein ABZW18_17050 [Streptomyces sp. NPDC004647]|uniref:hypothetical protein n=1 Tax=Streptomyces sp. NPDC004647 TaxID=3154671 RepID=UPI00339DE196